MKENKSKEKRREEKRREEKRREEKRREEEREYIQFYPELVSVMHESSTDRSGRQEGRGA